MTAYSMLQTIKEFFRRLFKGARRVSIVPALPQAAPAASTAALRRERQSDKTARRSVLREMLKRTDGGTKHYGSKRAVNNHRGNGKGKRSGRQ
jgi:hypothetical protein